MAFVANTTQQLTLTDSTFNLTEREKRFLEKSWAKTFADKVFPAIDENIFSALYSDKASRPNTPVNVIVGALILKEALGDTDDELVEALMFDIRYQYALHTTSFEEQPLSDKTLSRFRKRCYDYENLHNVDLYHDCVNDLSDKIAKIMKLNGRVRRMDSMMIAANIRKLSRLELVYTCIAKLVNYIDKHHPQKLPENLKHYTNAEDFNQRFYHHRDEDNDKKEQELLLDCEQLIVFAAQTLKKSQNTNCSSVVFQSRQKLRMGNIVSAQRKTNS